MLSVVWVGGANRRVDYWIGGGGKCGAMAGYLTRNGRGGSCQISLSWCFIHTVVTLFLPIVIGPAQPSSTTSSSFLPQLRNPRLESLKSGRVNARYDSDIHRSYREEPGRLGVCQSTTAWDVFADKSMEDCWGITRLGDISAPMGQTARFCVHTRADPSSPLGYKVWWLCCGILCCVPVAQLSCAN